MPWDKRREIKASNPYGKKVLTEDERLRKLEAKLETELDEVITGVKPRVEALELVVQKLIERQDTIVDVINEIVEDLSG